MDAAEIAKWVIDNRCPKDKKISDQEMFDELVIKINSCGKESPNCFNCKHIDGPAYLEPCTLCINFSKHESK